MQAAVSLVPGLEDVVTRGDPGRRATAVRQISALFVQGAARFGAEHVELFDDVLTRLVPDTDFDLRGELAEQMAALANAPPQLVKRLAREQEIRIAGPLLRQSAQIDDDALLELARHRGQPHLMAIAQRGRLAAPLTDVLVRRGDRDVVRRVAGNAGADFSPAGYSGMVRRAEHDGVLALTVGKRADIPAPLLKDLLACSVDEVRRRLLEAADPARKATIEHALGELTGECVKPVVRRDFVPAQRTILTLRSAGALNEGALLNFAKAHHYEETVAALSSMSRVRIATLDQLLSGERDDPILMLGKSLGLEWVTVRALIALRWGPGRPAPAPDIEDARLNFQRLAAPTAQRVLAFWRSRES